MNSYQSEISNRREKSAVYMKFHFGCISKRPDILMDMCRHFISGSVYMIFYHPKRNFISVKMNDMKSSTDYDEIHTVLILFRLNSCEHK